MFTGIIQAKGKIAEQQPSGGDMRLRIATGKLDLTDVMLGDSIAVNGTCLTVVTLLTDGFWADVSGETLQYTSLGNLKPMSEVNLEKAMTPTARFGGHIVSGHVDGLGVIKTISQDARSWRFWIEAPAELAKYIAHKGSITVDGVSLTVNKVDGAKFELNIIPHTMEETIMGTYKVGSRVNLEVDVVARYLERLLMGDKAAESGSSSTLDENFLAKHGFMK
jgi:riboflavin synthase